MTFYVIEKDYDLSGHQFIESIVKPILGVLSPSSRAYLSTVNPMPSDWEKNTDRSEIERHVTEFAFEEDIAQFLPKLPRNVARSYIRKVGDQAAEFFRQEFDVEKHAVWWHELEAGNPSSVDRVENELAAYLDSVYEKEKPKGKSIDGWIIVNSGINASYPKHVDVYSPRVNSVFTSFVSILEKRGSAKSKSVFDVYDLGKNKNPNLAMIAYYDYDVAKEKARRKKDVDLVGVRAIGPKRVYDDQILILLFHLINDFQINADSLLDRKHFAKMGADPSKIKSGVIHYDQQLTNIGMLDLFVDKLVDAFWSGNTASFAYESLGESAKKVIFEFESLYQTVKHNPSMMILSPAGFQGSKTSKEKF